MCCGFVLVAVDLRNENVSIQPHVCVCAYVDYMGLATGQDGTRRRTYVQCRIEGWGLICFFAKPKQFWVYLYI